jgi:Outer membrane protein beta-barrel domain
MQMQITRKFKRYILFLFTITALFSGEILAQAEIFGFGGYMTYSSIAVREGDLKFDDGPNFGFGLDVEVQRGVMLELNYTHQQTAVRLKRFNGLNESLFDMNTHYFQVGALYEFRESRKQKAFPYTIATLGATLFDTKDASLSDEWRFSVAFGLGGKFYLGKNIGLRLQTRLLMPLTFSGGGLWCGTGGCSVGVGAWTSLVQFDFTAGVFIRLGK